MRAVVISNPSSSRHVLPIQFPGRPATHSTTTSAFDAEFTRVKRTGTPLVDHWPKLDHTASTRSGCHPDTERPDWINTRTGRVAPRSQRARDGRATVVMSAAAATGTIERGVRLAPMSVAPRYSGINSETERRMAVARAVSESVEITRLAWRDRKRSRPRDEGR